MLEKSQFNTSPSLEKKENYNEKLDVEIRIAVPEEWKGLKDLRLNILNKESGNSYVATFRQIREIKKRTDKQWKDILFGKDKFSVIALKDSEIVGMGRAEKNKEIWYLYNLGVKNELRRARIGAKLTAIQLNEIKMRGGKELRIFVSKRNVPSLKNAESFGFRRDNTFLGRLKNLMIIDDLNNPVTTKRIEEVLKER